ncbi:MAG: glycosyltransferase family 4 protein [Hyphomonadaceae bacterium]|nr:glycosyltransferase family 4 protein [Hyphomonadaceae bacterium]
MANVIFPFLGGGVGGSHISAFGLADSLQHDYGVNCVVFCREGTRSAEEAGKRGFELVFTGEKEAHMRHNPFYDLVRQIPRLQRLSRFRREPTIVHCQDIGALQSWGPPAKAMGLPVVYHHRSINRAVLPNKMALAFADAAIAISESARENLSYVPARKLTHIVNPFTMQSIDQQAARKALLSEIGASPDARLYGFVGNYWRRKRPFFFLNVCRAIAQEDPRARFLLFGRDGEITELELRRRARVLNLGRRTHFLGFRTPPEANIASLDVLLAPALKEPFGRTLVEALLLGVPYIATDDAGHSEIASRWGGGVLCPEQANAAEFAAAALAVTRGEVTPVLSMRRRSEVAEQLSGRAHAQAVLKVYRKVSPKFAAAVAAETGLRTFGQKKIKESA